MNLLRTRWLFALVAIVMLSGCGKGAPNVEYVEGVVSLDGTPIAGAIVGFSPVSREVGVAATGTTDANGVFKLTAQKGGEFEKGTALGEYYVSFSKEESSGVSMTEEDSKKAMADPNYGKESGSGPSEAPKPGKNIIPLGYGNPLTSGVKVTVKSGKNMGDEFKFNLKSDFQGIK